MSRPCFISYTGESLDYKTPLLKANHALNIAATTVCRYFDLRSPMCTPRWAGSRSISWWTSDFSMPDPTAAHRPDPLRRKVGQRATDGRSLLRFHPGTCSGFHEGVRAGSPQARNPHRKPVTTRLPRVSTSAHRCSRKPNIAVDHNLLVMDLMEKIAIKHRFRILFGENPFAGLNGNGKHNNWSLATSHDKKPAVAGG